MSSTSNIVGLSLKPLLATIFGVFFICSSSSTTATSFSSSTSSTTDGDDAATGQQHSLDQFVTRFEYVHYDKELLMHHHQRLRRSTFGGTPLKLSFSALNRNFDLHLYPDDQYFHKSSTIYNNKGKVSKAQIKSYMYSGHDKDKPWIKAIGSLAFGVFDGKIKDGDEVFYIEPSNRYMNESIAKSHSVVYRKSDIDMTQVYKDHPEATPCGATTRTQQRILASTIIQEQNEAEPHHQLDKRQSFDSKNVRCSLNVIADYKFYSALTSGDNSALREAQAAALIRLIISEGSENFERQDFNGDGVPDGIQFSIFNLTVETELPPNDSPFKDDFLGAAAYLNAHSDEDWSQFCLSYRFTYRDFAQGVLGLAYVAASGSRGGICDDVGSDSKTFNTGIVTLVNFGSRVTNVVAGLTFTHEAGHNFGSQHDPADDERDCQPSNDNGGKYVMFDRANDGSRRNNKNFSPCSKEMMLKQIQSKGQSNSGGCFILAADDCGNDFLDEGEACDCGLNYDRDTFLCNDDPCCNGSSCKLANNMECSPMEGDCCSDNCTFIDDGVFCREEADCALSQTCNGSSAVCPVSEPRPTNDSFIMCTTEEKNITKYCLNGVCEGSVCIPLGLDDCECTQTDKLCHVCCVLANGTCESTMTISETNSTAKRLLPGGVGQVLEIGYPCNDFTGYCNLLDKCQLIDAEGALKRLTSNIINSDTFNTFYSAITEYWWACIVGVVVLLIAMFLIVLFCHCALPRPKHMKERAERRQRIRNDHQRRRNEIQLTKATKVHNKYY